MDVGLQLSPRIVLRVPNSTIRAAFGLPQSYVTSRFSYPEIAATPLKFTVTDKVNRASAYTASC